MPQGVGKIGTDPKTSQASWQWGEDLGGLVHQSRKARGWMAKWGESTGNWRMNNTMGTSTERPGDLSV